MVGEERWSMASPTMDLVDNARAQLEPLLEAVIRQLHAERNSAPVPFFSLLFVHLQQIQDEGDLANLFFELSTTAFQGFEFSESQAALVDQLLGVCESIAFTLSAPSTDAH
jgi:hypothetical protein